MPQEDDVATVSWDMLSVHVPVCEAASGRCWKPPCQVFRCWFDHAMIVFLFCLSREKTVNGEFGSLKSGMEQVNVPKLTSFVRFNLGKSVAF